MDRKITMESFDKLVDKLLEPFDEWGTAIDVEVDQLPKKFDKEALSYILKASNALTLKLIKKAIGVAFVEEHDVVTTDDCKIALHLHEFGTDLLKNNW